MSRLHKSVIDRDCFLAPLRNIVSKRDALFRGSDIKDYCVIGPSEKGFPNKKRQSEIANVTVEKWESHQSDYDDDNHNDDDDDDDDNDDDDDDDDDDDVDNDHDHDVDDVDDDNDDDDDDDDNDDNVQSLALTYE
ncbi:hypothetical protein HZH68_006406 [Vespula germanica]|uniref:Uncharacterized protein n=1 Tax=Vespula germanica TaxID=30212 RepID=A0A834KBF9_VESGE|nr:hypothetical protein HZH68_006406 [Vespula germanica]